MTEDYPIRFECQDCGRHITHFGVLRPRRCAACSTIPGWYKDPALAKRIDPDFEVKAKEGAR